MSDERRLPFHDPPAEGGAPDVPAVQGRQDRGPAQVERRRAEPSDPLSHLRVPGRPSPPDLDPGAAPHQRQVRLAEPAACDVSTHDLALLLVAVAALATVSGPLGVMRLRARPRGGITGHRPHHVGRGRIRQRHDAVHRLALGDRVDRHLTLGRSSTPAAARPSCAATARQSERRGIARPRPIRKEANNLGLTISGPASG